MLSERWLLRAIATKSRTPAALSKSLLVRLMPFGEILFVNFPFVSLFMACAPQKLDAGPQRAQGRDAAGPARPPGRGSLGDRPPSQRSRSRLEILGLARGRRRREPPAPPPARRPPRSSPRPRLRRLDRWLIATLATQTHSLLEAVLVVRPATVLRWHQAAWRLWWRLRSRRRVGRPPIDAELRALIRRMWRENRLRGENRIAVELAKLGWRVSTTWASTSSTSPRQLSRFTPAWASC